MNRHKIRAIGSSLILLLSSAAIVLAASTGAAVVTPFTAAAHNFLTGFNAAGVPQAAQPASTDLSDSASVARLASPTFTGTPAAPTATAGTNTTQLATTAFCLANSGAQVAHHLCTSSELLNMFTTPIQIVPGQTGFIMPLMFTYHYNHVTTDYTGAGGIVPTYGSNPGSATRSASGGPGSGTITSNTTPFRTSIPLAGSYAATFGTSTGLYLTNTSAAFTGGDGTLDVWVAYAVAN